ncbi:LOW QUALITY PROTEIN: Putative retroelement [Phytophthora palmivora]|uniref:Retroelement n=1 Tax=Phytophthora palmivora TaxID=4796 RepID=A0A2P4Y899_9STRA|nr:LOW QUALITY PROTEIN: Putative retroelement [Phytophthora palmivora]
MLLETQCISLGPEIYTDHEPLRTATNSPHLSQRMARWLSFFAEYNFCIEYNPGKLNVLADAALSRRPDYDELAHVSRVTTDLYDRIRLAYQVNENYTPLVRFLSDGKDSRQAFALTAGAAPSVDPGDPLRVVVPTDEDLKYDILLEAHGAPWRPWPREDLPSGLSDILVARMYEWVAHYVKTCETCQRVKPSGHASAPLQSLPVPADCWKSMSLDFVFGLPADDRGNTGILVFVCRLSKMVHLAPAFRYQGLPDTIVSDRDPCYTGAFWYTLFQHLGTKLTISTADHPQMDGETGHVNRVLGASVLRHLVLSQVPLSLRGGTDISIVSGEETRKTFSSQVSDTESESFKKRQIVIVYRQQPDVDQRGCNDGSAYTIDLTKSMSTQPMFYGSSPQLEEGQGESSPPQIEVESHGQPEQPVAKPVN